MKEYKEKLIKLLCEGAQKNGICYAENFTECKHCGHCTILADFLVKHNVVIQEWTPATEPPAPYIPVFVSYIAWGTEDTICSDGVAFINDEGDWIWWEGSLEDSDEECVVKITHWMPLPAPVQPAKEASDAEKWKTSYNLSWRNVTVTWVDWNNKKMGVKIGSMKEQTLDFADLEISSSSDIQAIKMICDRLITQMYRTELQHNGRVNALLMEYVSDLLSSPYEWSTKL